MTALVGALLLLVSSCGSDAPATKVTAPPGEEITVTRDAIKLGSRLVGMSVAKEDGRLYVLAGHYRSEVDRLFAPEASALAAFDDDGVELWRTDLGRRPGDVIIVDGDPWVLHQTGPTVSRIDASDGRLIGDLTVKRMRSVIGAFGSAWVTSQEGTEDGIGPGRLIRIDPDGLSATNIDVPFFAGECHDGAVEPPDDAGWCPERPAAGAGAVCVPLKDRGVAMIDPETNLVTVIPAEDIGHEVLQVAVDGDTAYVASRDQVTSVVDGEIRATATIGPFAGFGDVDGVFGAHLGYGRFLVLGPGNRLVAEERQIVPADVIPKAINGESWVETGRNYSLRRVELLPNEES